MYTHPFLLRVVIWEVCCWAVYYMPFSFPSVGKTVVANGLILSLDLLLNQRPFSLEMNQQSNQMTKFTSCLQLVDTTRRCTFSPGSFPHLTRGKKFILLTGTHPRPTGGFATFLRKFSSDSYMMGCFATKYLRKVQRCVAFRC